MAAVATDPREDFSGWMLENYDTHAAAGVPTLVCKRCGVPVFHLTKHAADVHGDPVEVMPSKAGPQSVKRWTDTYGADSACGVWPKAGA